MKDNNLTGAGPFTWELPALDPGEEWHIDFKRREKGRYRRHQPFSEALIKNYDPDNRIIAEINGGAKNQVVDVDPNGKDSYSEVGIRYLTIRNAGSSTIAAEQITLTVKSDPYDADDQARERKAEPPIRGIVRNITGI